MAFLSASLDRARDWGECALNLAFPWPETTAAEPVPVKRPFCERCGDPYPSMGSHYASFLCSHCAGCDWPFKWARAAYRTDGQVLDAIIGFKYRDEYYHHARLINWLNDAFVRHVRRDEWHALVPVPLFHRRHRERGFNQARELANGLGKNQKMPVWNCLYRCRETISQTGLERNKRFENMAGAFVTKRGFDVKGRNLLIVDDVFTTGATVNACAQALAQAGAGSLAVLTIARS